MRAEMESVARERGDGTEIQSSVKSREVNHSPPASVLIRTRWGNIIVIRKGPGWRNVFRVFGINLHHREGYYRVH